MTSLMVRFILSAIVVGGMLIGMLHFSAALRSFQRHTDNENAQIACLSDVHCTAQ
jgi:hypothetical protein